MSTTAQSTLTRLSSYIPNVKQAWLRRINHAASRVQSGIGLHSEAVMQKALISELQTFDRTSVAQEVQLPIYYTNSRFQKINVGYVRLDIVYHTPCTKFVLELKVAGHSKKATLQQLQKYRKLLDANADNSVLVLVEFETTGINLYTIEPYSNVVRPIN